MLVKKFLNVELLTETQPNFSEQGRCQKSPQREISELFLEDTLKKYKNIKNQYLNIYKLKKN